MARLTKIDSLIAQQHFHLAGKEGVQAYFLREYTAGAGYASSETNDLISNLKKSPERRSRPEWRYKEQAIRRLGSELAEVFEGWKELENATFVPMPPSKSKDHPEYDDRMIQILSVMKSKFEHPLDIRELLLQTVSRTAVYEKGSRLGPEQLLDIFSIDEVHCDPTPGMILLVDDVLTTGAHHLAATATVRERFPDVEIFGIYLARTIWTEEGVDLLPLP